MIWAVDEPVATASASMAGILGGLSVTLLAVAVFFLWRSMRKQMKKIDPSLPKGTEEERFEAEQIPEEPGPTPGA